MSTDERHPEVAISAWRDLTAFESVKLNLAVPARFRRENACRGSGAFARILDTSHRHRYFSLHGSHKWIKCVCCPSSTFVH